MIGQAANTPQKKGAEEKGRVEKTPHFMQKFNYLPSFLPERGEKQKMLHYGASLTSGNWGGGEAGFERCVYVCICVCCITMN